ncbi:MAG: hypothetical protein RR202_11415 [Bacteroidales bacterium]
MAKKTLRLHNYAQHNSGWHTSIFPPQDTVNGIMSNCDVIATSIPSPFAQFDLIKSAFELVVRNRCVQGDTPQHRLISYTLDVAQLFYLSERYKEILKIIPWRCSNLNELADNETLRNSLQAYWDQDEEVYDFNRVDELFFLLYDNTIVGSTSPTTMFVPSPDVPMLGIDLRSGTHTFFKEIRSLEERDDDFILYFYHLVNQDHRTLKMPELRKYLDFILKDKTLLDRTVRNKIVNGEFPEYSPCTVATTHLCIVGPHTLGLTMPKCDSIQEESDFIIKPDFETNESLIPMVLPNKAFNSRWVYTTKGVNWEYTNMAPETGGDVLPFLGEPYPWLGIGDFLEDKLIRIPYSIDHEHFFSAKNSKGENLNVLLPLKEVFFKYFSADYLNRYITISEGINKSITVRLNIPTRKGIVSLEKTYNIADIDSWAGDIAILPFYKSVNPDINIQYKFGVIDGETNKGATVPEFSLLNKGHRIENINSTVRLDGVISSFYSAFSNYQGDFDVIIIRKNKLQGVIVPLLKTYQGTGNGMDASIDFGTTNTHIECKIGEKISELAYDENSALYKTFLKDDAMHIQSQQRYLEHQLVPLQVGKKEEGSVSFPLRSALLINKNKSIHTNQIPFQDANAHLLHNEIIESGIFTSVTNLKWENFDNEEARERLNVYLGSILHLIYYKAISTNSDLRAINITWFYPVSLSVNNLQIMEQTWSNKFKALFPASDINRLSKITESIAPYYYYRKHGNQVMGLSASIDIGGGSADLAIFDGKIQNNNTPITISSFKFACNVIFGDGFSGSPDSNGFVQYFKDNISKKVDSKQRQKLEYILENNDSTEFSNFAFSMQNYNYLEEIRYTSDIKLCVLIYYAAVIYYLAQFMKRNGNDIPRNLMFSGNGSKTLEILDCSPNKAIIGKLFTGIFSHVFNKKTDQLIRVITDEDPKVLTCKGALSINQNNVRNTNSGEENAGIISTELKHWIGGINEERTDRIVLANDFNDLFAYNEIENSHINSVLHSVKDFYQMCDSCFSRECEITNNFGIDKSAYACFEDIRNIDLKDYLERGIEDAQSREGIKAPLSQTLFFYPLIGVLANLAATINSNKTK